MTKNKLNKEEKIQQELLEEKVSSIENFFEENKKIIWTILAVAVVAGLLVVAFFKFYANPRKGEALKAMFPAEAQFRAENYDAALNGDGNNLGFKELIEEYSSYAPESIYLYAGLCELKLANYEEAVKYLKKYSGSEPILQARALSSLADAFCGLENYKEAVSYYKKAAELVDNDFAAEYLLNEAIVLEKLGDNAKALELYNRIKEEYPNSKEGYTIDKYIARLKYQSK